MTKLLYRWFKPLRRNFPVLMPSFDKGFHRPENQSELKSLIDQVFLLKKASYPKPIANADTRLNLYKRKNNIQPLNRRLAPWKCMDSINALITGIDDFERYVALAILSRNLQKLAVIIRDRERQRLWDEKQKTSA